MAKLQEFVFDFAAFSYYNHCDNCYQYSSTIVLLVHTKKCFWIISMRLPLSSMTTVTSATLQLCVLLVRSQVTEKKMF